MLKKICETKDYLRQQVTSNAKTAIVLGTGLNNLADELEIQQGIPYAEIPNFPVSTVKGHAGNLIFGKLEGVELMVMQGRFHFYEGYDMQTLTFPIRVMKAFGIETLILSNASGGVNPNFRIGDIMLIRDHINFFPAHPLRGKNEESLGERFPNMSEVYDRALLQKTLDIAEKEHIPCQTGVYIGVQGPSFETPAEYRMYRSWGADCVGMSTVPEAIVCHHAGMKCLGFSVITNVFSDDCPTTDTHEDVLKAGAMAEKNLTVLIKKLIPEL